MVERVLFLTGRLARPRLERVLNAIQRSDLDWAIVDIGVKVAALMTQAIISRRLARPVDAARVVVPGRCRANLAALSTEFGVRFERGPDELKDLPAFLGAGARVVDLSRHDIRIFAEIVDASALSVDSIVARALAMAASGADVIDLGCRRECAKFHLTERRRGRVGVRRGRSRAAPRGFYVSLHPIKLAIAEFGDGANVGIGIDPDSRRYRANTGMRPDRKGSRDRRRILVDDERKRPQCAPVAWRKIDAHADRNDCRVFRALGRRKRNQTSSIKDGTALNMSSFMLFQVSSEGCS
jgi:hypothetical protein